MRLSGGKKTLFLQPANLVSVLLYRSLFPIPQFGPHLQIRLIPFLFFGKCVFLSLGQSIHT
jgi:hypothetical protein